MEDFFCFVFLIEMMMINKNETEFFLLLLFMEVIWNFSCGRERLKRRGGHHHSFMEHKWVLSFFSSSFPSKRKSKKQNQKKRKEQKRKKKKKKVPIVPSLFTLQQIPFFNSKLFHKRIYYFTQLYSIYYHF